jgi:hypothetical protein
VTAIHGPHAQQGLNSLRAAPRPYRPSSGVDLSRLPAWAVPLFDGSPVEPVVRRTPPHLRVRIHSLLYPHTELGRQATALARQREAAEQIPKQHLPKWRLRFVIALGFLPALWVLPRCRAAGCKHWPCGPLLRQLRAERGWTGSVEPRVRALSTKRRRAKAAARNPTAVSHRARPARR